MADSKLPRSKKKLTELFADTARKLIVRDALSVGRHIQSQYVQRTCASEWTQHDDKELRRLVLEKGMRWCEIAAEMGRPSDIVRLRYRDYVALGKKRKLGKWDTDEIARLKEIVREFLAETTWAEEEGLDVDVVGKYVNWENVSNKLGCRSRLQCRAKWIYLMEWQRKGP